MHMDAGDYYKIVEMAFGSLLDRIDIHVEVRR